jgi:hypothetical protein
MPKTTKITTRIKETVAGSSPSATTFVLFPGPANDGDGVFVTLRLHVRDDSDPTDYYVTEQKFLVVRAGSGFNMNSCYSGVDNSLAISPSVFSSGSDLIVTCTYSGTLRWEIEAELEQLD